VSKYLDAHNIDCDLILALALNTVGLGLGLGLKGVVLKHILAKLLRSLTCQCKNANFSTNKTAVIAACILIIITAIRKYNA